MFERPARFDSGSLEETGARYSTGIRASASAVRCPRSAVRVALGKRTLVAFVAIVLHGPLLWVVGQIRIVCRSTRTLRERHRPMRVMSARPRRASVPSEMSTFGDRPVKEDQDELVTQALGVFVYFTYTKHTLKVVETMSEVLRSRDCDVHVATIEFDDPRYAKRLEPFPLSPEMRGQRCLERGVRCER
jgi:hypothetical protein